MAATAEIGSRLTRGLRRIPLPRGLNRAAVWEILLFVAIVLVVDAAFFDGTRFYDLRPHPFWALILLVTVQYGAGTGVLASIVAAGALLLGNLPPQRIDQDLYQYVLSVAWRPLLWLVAAVALGEIRNRLVADRNDLSKHLAEQRRENAVLAENYERLKAVNADLELRVAGQLRTVFTIYNARKAIEKLDTDSVLEGIGELTRGIIDPLKFSVFLLRGDRLELTDSSGWEDNDRYARTFDVNTPIFQWIVGRRALLSAADDEHERVLDRQGLLAGPMISLDTGEVIGMLKIEVLGFLDFNTTTVENFRIVCEWIGTAVGTARLYEQAESERFIDLTRGVQPFGALRREVVFLLKLGRRLGFESSSLVVRPGDGPLPDDASRLTFTRAVTTAGRRSLRDTDQAFDLEPDGAAVAILLPATGAAEATTAAAKLSREIEAALEGSGIAATVQSVPIDSLFADQPAVPGESEDADQVLTGGVFDNDA
ncbi:MAG: GAF domain-containing protein [Alphaproteobacteria bacterium]